MVCKEIPECSFSLFKPAATVEGVCADMRNEISTKLDKQKHQVHQSRQFLYNDQENDELYWTDRAYKRDGNHNPHHDNQRVKNNNHNLDQRRKKRCYVCNKFGCWSIKHPTTERKSAYEPYKHPALVTIMDPNTGGFQHFLVEFEGTELDESDNDEIQQLMTELTIEKDEEHYFTEFGGIDGTSMITELQNQSKFHAITGIDKFDPNRSPNNIETFMINYRYSSSVFQDILPDTGAAGV
ncbi:hypothetical protein K3495_g9936 [Podosphaera aphanis]|nr:hypothetical protein K3495_g9936 [Podosphaera aphanis]